MRLFSGLLFLLMCLNASAAVPPSVVSFKFNGQTTSLVLEFGGKTTSVKPDENGNAVVKMAIDRPQYVKLLRVKIPELLYLYPGDNLEVSIKGEARGELEFKGKNEKLNAHLAKWNNSTVGFGGEEADYILRLKESVSKSTENLLSLGFDKVFVEKEKKRIAARIYTMLVTYPPMRKRTERTYKPSDAYFKFVDSVIFEDKSMLVLNEYKDFMQYLVHMMATKDIVKYDAFDYSKRTLDYVIANVKEPAIKAHLINYYSYDYLKRNGIEKVAAITPIFKKYVKDKEQNKIYDAAIVTWSKIGKGAQMAEYTFNDANDKPVTLSSLRGKYVYIDMWATWCVPCIAEIPHLKKLEAALEGKNIHFVSISTDKDVDAWKKMLKKDNFTGTQLHAPTREFSKDLMVVSIPRFILIDPNGKMVDADMSRPSKPETLKALNALPGM